MFTTRPVQSAHNHPPAPTATEKKLLLTLVFTVALTGVLLVVKH